PLEILGFNQLDDVPASGDAVTSARIELDHVYAAGLNEALVTFDVPFILAGADGGSDGVAKLAMRIQIVWRKRLLDPFQSIRFEIAKSLDRGRHIPDAARARRINDKLQLIANHAAHQADDFDVLLAVLSEDGFWPHAPAGFDDPVSLIAAPREFLQRPV